MHISTTVMAGYGPLDQADEVGIEEALVMEEVAAQEHNTACVEMFAGLTRRGTVDLDHDDLARGFIGAFG